MNALVLFGIAHGLLWKVLSTLSKIVFLIIVVPRLPSGVFAEYIYSISITMIMAMVLSAGTSEHLPTLIKGKRDAMDRYSPFYIVSVTLGWFFLFAYILTRQYFFLLAALAFTHATYLIIAGLLRSIDPKYYEWLNNFPTILFTIICIAVTISGFEHLILIFILTNMTINMAIAFHGEVSISVNYDRLRSAFEGSVGLAMKGITKTISNMLLIADFRALIIFPKFLLKHNPSDALAIAITAGEALWQLAMVIVNRNYVHYCKGEGTLRSSMRSGGILMLGMVFASVIFIYFGIPITIEKFDWHLVGWATVFFGSMIVFMEFRYFFWSRHVAEIWIFATQILIILVQIIVMFVLDEAMWLPATAMILMGVTIIFLIIGLVWKR